MPIAVFRCHYCLHLFERLVGRISKGDVVPCPECGKLGGLLEPTAATVHFKGDGCWTVEGERVKLKRIGDRLVRANRYQWNKPHDRANAQLRRLRQLALGQIKSAEITQKEAADLLLQAMAQVREQQGQARQPDPTP